MAWIAIIAGLIAAAMNAGSSVLQRLATGKPDSKALFSAQFTRQVTLSRLFLLGLGLQTAAFVVQAVALSNGPLTLVEPLLTTDLIFLLIFIYVHTHVKAGGREWSGVAAIMLGLSGLFLAAQPQGGQLRYAALPWIITTTAIGCVVLAIVFTVRRLPEPRLRGVLAGLAAAAIFALNAALTKLALNQWQSGGLGQMLTSWPVYGLVVSGIVSLFVMQNAYGAGPLAITQPTMEIVEPSISVVIGIAIFGDSVSHTPLALSGEIVSAIVLAGGIVALSTSKRIYEAGRQGL
jgi:drug/metabolite transporter (DMT)-like permease